MSRGGKVLPRFTKTTLPSKVCAACRKPFTWRKVWARDWDKVRFCSERCRKTGGLSVRR